MRRLVVELPFEELIDTSSPNAFFDHLASLEVLYLLRIDREETSGIVRLRLKNGVRSLEQLAAEGGVETAVLENRDGTYTCFLRITGESALSDIDLLEGGGYFVTPTEIREGRLRLTFVGTAAQVRAFLGKLGSAGVHREVVSVSDARFAPDSALALLTEKQRRVLVAAFEQGYYDRPRRTSSQKLARMLNMSSSTLVDHRLKAERRVLTAVLGRKR